MIKRDEVMTDPEVPRSDRYPLRERKEFATVLSPEDDGNIRKFASGATRDTAEDKYDPEGFLSPLVIERFCEYMHKNRLQTDGSLRNSDNWQNGFGYPTLMKSTWRHFFDMWKIHRGIRATRREKGEVVVVSMEDALCGLIFNVMAYLHEMLIEKVGQKADWVKK